MTVTTDVVESDLTVELGQAATVTVDAIGTTVEGTVTAISPVRATTRPGSCPIP